MIAHPWALCHSAEYLQNSRTSAGPEAGEGKLNLETLQTPEPKLQQKALQATLLQRGRLILLNLFLKMILTVKTVFFFPIIA